MAQRQGAGLAGTPSQSEIETVVECGAVEPESPIDGDRSPPGGGNAVEPLSLHVHLPGNSLDLSVETVQATEGLGMGKPEVLVGEVLSFEIRQQLLGLGQLPADSRPLRPGQVLKGVP